MGNVFARVILNWIRDHLLAYQRLESFIMPIKSTINCVLVLRVLISSHQLEYQNIKQVFAQGLSNETHYLYCEGVSITALHPCGAGFLRMIHFERLDQPNRTPT